MQSQSLLEQVQQVGDQIFEKRSIITKQGYKAKELAANMNSEITNKLRMFKRIKKQKDTYTYGALNKIRFMHSRLKEMSLSLERARTNIDVALDQFTQQVDNELMKYNFRLNNIMLTLTFVTIIFMPPGIIGGIMGMNVVVPGQVTDENAEDPGSLAPFFTVIGMIGFFMMAAAVTMFLLDRRAQTNAKSNELRQR